MRLSPQVMRPLKVHDGLRNHHDVREEDYHRKQRTMGYFYTPHIMYTQYQNCQKRNLKNVIITVKWLWLAALP